ncbi:hypothetical protein E2542_SST05782 [Spatholobus suberectus]|nr:hypothetical protein E2542_SST05782 [Spatholobus suberectus]
MPHFLQYVRKGLQANFIKENHEKHAIFVKHARNRYNNFKGSCGIETHTLGGFKETNYSSYGEAHEILKPFFASWAGQAILPALKIIEKNKTTCKRKDDYSKKIIIEGLLGLKYNTSICKSHWGI